MTSRLLVLDYGSNSLRWLLADHLPGAPLQPLETGGETTRLGRGLASDGEGGSLEPAAVERALEATERAVGYARSRGATVFKATATHFARRLAGVEAFAEELRERFGLRLHLLSGEGEAYLTRRGVEEGLSLLGLDPRSALCVDVGGGSTELSWWEAGRLQIRSLELGALSATGAFLTTDPPSSRELLELRTFVHGALLDAGAPESPALVAASGGTATTLAALELGLDDYRPLLIQGSRLSARRLDALIDELAAEPPAQRRERLTLEPERAEIIVAGAVILHELLAVLGAPELLVSDYDLKHGAALTDLAALDNGPPPARIT